MIRIREISLYRAYFFTPGKDKFIELYEYFEEAALIDCSLERGMRGVPLFILHEYNII